MCKQWFILSFALVIIVISICGCTTTAPPQSVSPTSGQTSVVLPSTPPTGSQVSSSPFTLMVDSLAPGSILPDTYTCNGASESPPVSWLNVPAGTQSLILILDDPDAPAGTFTHWIVYNIPLGIHEIPKNGPDAGVLAHGTSQGKNSAGSTGYFPPCPPPGKSHRYVFTLYAVDTDIPQAIVDRASISQALTGHTLGQAQFVTIYVL